VVLNYAQIREVNGHQSQRRNQHLVLLLLHQIKSNQIKSNQMLVVLCNMHT
jgi:hypothetical protein